MLVQPHALAHRVSHQRPEHIQALCQEPHERRHIKPRIRLRGRGDFRELHLARRAPRQRPRCCRCQAVDRAVRNPPRCCQIARSELQHAATRGRPAHHPVAHPHRVHDIQRQQRDMRRLHDVAAGVEYHLRRILAVVVPAKPGQRFRRKLQTRQDAHALRHPAKPGKRRLPPLNRCLPRQIGNPR